MKDHLKRIAIVTICHLVSIVSWAGDLYPVPSVGDHLLVDDIAYVVTSVDPLTVKVTYEYNTLVYSGLHKNYTGEVVIPETIRYNYEGSGVYTFTVTAIDDNAFQYGSGMIELTIPASITKISGSAFTNATGLKKLTFLEGDPLSLEWYSGTVGFDKCPIEELYLYRQLNATRTSPHFKYTRTVHFGNRVTRIENSMFSGNETLERLVIPGSVSSIGSYAFLNCTNLKTVKFEYGPDKLYIVSDNSYPEINSFNYTSLDSLYIERNLDLTQPPQSGKSSAISKVKHVVVGDKVSEISEGLFRGSTVLETVHIGKGVETIEEDAFIGCSNLYSVVLDCPITTIESSVFSGCGFETIIIPNTVRTISSYAFSSCRNLKKIVIPQSVSSIGIHSFWYCDNLKSLVIEDGDTELSICWGDYQNDHSFNNPPLDSLYLGRNIGSSSATYNQLSPFGQVKRIKISGNVTAIPNKLFHNCSNLESVEVEWQNPITIDKSVFENYYNYNEYANATLLVPGGTVKNYQATSAWNQFANIVPTSIGVRMTATAGGSIRLGETVVNGDTKLLQFEPNSVLTFEITPEDTHFLESVTLNGEDVTAQVVDGKLTPADLSEDLELTVTFKAKPFYVVTVTASAGGTATAGSESVMQGRCTTVTLTANEGYELKSLTVNGVDKTSEVVDGVLTLSNIQEAQTVVATFQKLRFAVTALECENGSIDLSATEVEWGGEVVATLGGAAHYEVATVSVNGEDRTAQVVDNALTVTDIRQAITIGATFRLERFAVTAMSNEGGTVLLSADEAEWGSNVTVTVSPENGYELVSVSVDGEDVTERLTANQYTIASVEHDTQVVVEFRLITEATITLSAYGESTYCSDHDLDFSGVEGLKAYIASGYYPATGSVLLTRVSEVPAGTGIMVKGEAGTYKVPYTETSAYFVNMFVGNVEPTVINPTDGSYSNFYLTTGSSGFGFYRVSKTRTMSANRAYLQLPTSLVSSESRIGIQFEDETEGIADLRIDNLRLDGNSTYDLQGRKQEGRMKPGLYIRGGKKIVIN